MRQLNPAYKFVGIAIPTLLLLFFYSPILNLVLFFACLGILLCSRGSKKALLVALIPVLLSALALFFTGYHFPSQSYLALNYQLFSNGAVWNGLQLASRTLAFAGLGLLFALTTDPVELVRSAQQQMRVPVKFAYGLLAAWSMVPNMLREYSRARAAFRARGLTPAPWSPALLRPLLVKTVRWSDSLAAAMDSQGFGGSSDRTEYYVSRGSAIDRLSPILTTGCFFAAVALNNALV